MEWFLNSFFLMWACALLGAFPLALWVGIALRDRTRVSRGWRLVVCAIVACALTPSMLYVKGGPVPLPPVVVFCTYGMELDGLAFVILGVVPICVATLVLFSLWTIQLNFKARGRGTLSSADEQTEACTKALGKY